MDHNPNFKDGKAGAAISVRVNTRAPRTEFAGIMEDGTIKIKLTSPPIDGKANEELVKFLAAVMQIPKKNVEIISGHASKNKLVVLFGVDSDRVNQLIVKELNTN
jgi:uncharacterized protein (TIGR00251 family)